MQLLSPSIPIPISLEYNAADIYLYLLVCRYIPSVFLLSFPLSIHPHSCNPNIPYQWIAIQKQLRA